MYSKVNAFEQRASTLRFGPYVVDVGAHSLLKDGSRVSVQEQPFQILLALLECPGKVVTREELRVLLWGSETFVDFNQSMNSAIRRLRAALADNPKRPVYIETVPRIGFRFLAQVHIETPADEHFDEIPALEKECVNLVEGKEDGFASWFLSIAAASRWLSPISGAVIICAALITSLWFAASGHSLYPANSALAVIAPSYVSKTTRSDFASGLEQTNLRAKVRTTVPYAQALAVPAVHATALDLALLQGRYFLEMRNVESYERANEAFHRALILDPGCTAAMVGLAQVHILLTMEGVNTHEHAAAAKSFAERALALDPDLASAHTALAAAEVVGDWNWSAAREEFKKAIGLDPSDSLSHLWYAMFVLVPAKQYAEAEQQTLRAIELDPMSLIAQTNLGLIYATEGRRKEALAQYRLVLHMNAKFVPARYRIAQLLESEGRHKEALLFEPSDSSLVHHRMHLTLLQQAHAGDPCSLAGAALKRKLPNAGSLLRTGVQQHCAPLIYLNQNPDFARLQKDPHFADLAHDLDLPEP